MRQRGFLRKVRRRRPMDKGNNLDSWKDIAAYLGRNVRTCRNWEKDLGLPIHSGPTRSDERGRSALAW